MPVNVIGTLKPKNNGKFPVAEAADIKVKDNLRLDEALETSIVYVTPQMYGAKGDGITDDTEAFIQALSQNKIVYIPNGDYIISDTLSISNQTPIIGENMVQTKLKFTGENTSLITCTSDRCIIEDILLLGSFNIAEVGTSNTNSAISCSGFNYHKFSNVYIKGFNIGINSSPYGYGSYFKNCEIQSCNYGIYSSSEFNMITIDTGIVTYCDVGILLSQGRTQNVINTDIERCNIGIKKNHMGNCLISGCYFENNEQYAIQMAWGMQPVDSMIISNNSFYSGKNFRAPLIGYTGRANSTLVVSDNCMQSSVPAENETIDEVLILKGASGTPVFPVVKNNWYSNLHILYGPGEHLDEYNNKAKWYYAGAETDFNNIVTDTVKRFRFFFDSTKTITPPEIAGLKSPSECIEFFAFSSSSSAEEQMLIRSNSENGYVVLGITRIEPNKSYKMIFNRRVNDQYNEFIVFN